MGAGAPFLGPCVLPLVPPYFTFIAGTTIEEISREGEGAARRDVAFAAILFGLGFTTVFVLLGATASVFGQMVRAHLELLGRHRIGLVVAHPGLPELERLGPEAGLTHAAWQPWTEDG